MMNNDKINLLLENSYGHYSFDSEPGNIIDNYVSKAGIDYMFNELGTLSFKAGINYSKSRNNELSYDDNREKFGSLGIINIYYKHAWGYYSLRYDKDYLPSGSYGMVNRDNVSVKMGYNITSQITGNLNYIWSKSRSQNELFFLTQEYRDYYNGYGILLNVKLIKNLTLELQYDYQIEKKHSKEINQIQTTNPGSSSNDYKRNIFYIRLKSNYGK